MIYEVFSWLTFVNIPGGCLFGISEASSQYQTIDDALQKT